MGAGGTHDGKGYLSSSKQQHQHPPPVARDRLQSLIASVEACLHTSMLCTCTKYDEMGPVVLFWRVWFDSIHCCSFRSRRFPDHLPCDHALGTRQEKKRERDFPITSLASFSFLTSGSRRFVSPAKMAGPSRKPSNWRSACLRNECPSPAV